MRALSRLTFIDSDPGSYCVVGAALPPDASFKQ